MLPLIFSLVFFALLEGSAFFVGGYFWLSALGAFALSFYAIWRADFVKKSALLAPAALLILIVVSLLGLSRNIVFSQIIILTASLIFYALASGYLARNAVATALVSFVELIAVVFLLLAHQTASAAVSGWVAGPLLFIAVFALFFSSIFLAVSLSRSLIIRLSYFSLLAGIAVTEFYFALSRLPFNLPSIDFLVFIIYYGLWDVSLRYFSLRLTRNILLFDVLLVLLSFAFIFSSAKWFP